MSSAVVASRCPCKERRSSWGTAHAFGEGTRYQLGAVPVGQGNEHQVTALAPDERREPQRRSPSVRVSATRASWVKHSLLALDR